MEVCVDNIASALEAAKGGATRLELCSSLAEGGLSPSPGMMALLKAREELKSLEIFALIRPRGGDFLYSQEEIDVMEKDIQILSSYGADGFVLGCLEASGHVDKQACSKLIQACHKKPATFHRAFDMAKDPKQALQDIIDLGFVRLLTSGQQKTAFEGRHLIHQLQTQFGREISIMAGGGINEDNIMQLLQETGIPEFHASARATVASQMTYRNPNCTMGSDSQEYSLKVTSGAKVKRLIELAKAVRK